MNGRTDNITLTKHEYELIVAYRKCTDINFRNSVCKLLDVSPQSNKTIPKSNKIIPINKIK